MIKMYINKWLFIYFFFLISITLCLHSFNEKAYSQTILKGGIRTVIEKGNSIEVNLNTPINFYFSQVGDEVSAFTKEDILIGDDFYIPKGSRIEGIITNVKKPKHFGISGAFEIDFNKIIIPNNTTIPIYASVTTDTSRIEKQVASILTYDSALIAYGTFNGALAGIQYGGIPLAILSHGISVLSGAGVGASFGIIGSVVRKGDIPTILTEKYIPVVLKSDFHVFGELPNKREGETEKGEETEYKGFRFSPIVKKEEIELAIKNIKSEHSQTYGDYIVLEFNLKNNSHKKISLSDIVLINKSEIVPLHPDLFLSGLEALKTINSSDEANASLAFLIQDKKDNYFLAILDPLDKTEIIKIPLNKYFNKKKKGL